MIKTLAEILRKGRERRANGDRGATPIEILAGLVLLGIIFSFIIVKFFAWRETTQDKGTQGNLRNGALAAESVYTILGNYGDIGDLVSTTAADCDGVDGNKMLNCIEPTLEFTATPADLEAGDNRILVAVNDSTSTGSGGDPGQESQVITLTALSSSGRVWCQQIVSDDGFVRDPGAWFGGGNKVTTVAADTCAGGPMSVAAGDWRSKF